MSCGSKKLPTPGAAWCMRWFMGLLILSCVTSIAAGTGMCGHQCTDDGDCLGCGGAGKCSCPDAGTPFSAISCSCVDMPSDPPTHPPADIKLSTWPMQWSANVSAFVYADFTNHTSLAAGRFYYDGIGGHSRADWRPYTSGNDATQVWIADWKAGKSNYYVKSGPLCISFPIRVPGTQVAVGVERPDWMPRCEAAGIARYAGRERVGVNGRAVWVDHYSCHVEDIEANQAITFQNWHSLGLAPDDPPKGLPLRVTGGNSAPDGQKGSPRLSTVWYSDFQVGPASSSPSDFKRPALVCIPVALEVAEAFVGGRLTAASVFDATFHPAAHALLESVHATRPIIPEAELPGRTSIEASSTLIPNADHIATTTNADATDATDAALASSFDLRRAQTSRPRPAYQGRTFESMNEALNKALQRMPAVVASEACERFTLSELRELMAEHLLPVADEALLAIYDAAAHDGRRHTGLRTASELRSQWAVIDGVSIAASPATREALEEMHRDGLCHQAVMWFVHHLSTTMQREVGKQVTLPLLPVMQHGPPAHSGADEALVYAHYSNATSCQVCHFAR